MQGVHAPWGVASRGGGVFELPVVASPTALLKVRGRHQDLGCELDTSHLVLGEALGEDGSRSQVFAAEYHEPETGISHAVAVKKFPLARTPQELQSAHREIGVMYLASTRCRYCARCWGYTQDADGTLMLVMKRYQQSLNTKLRAMPNGRLSLSDVQRYGALIARAGVELHEQNVVMSDLKPANILLDEFDDIAIADFGISKLLKRGEKQDEGLHGTFNYMSPEAFDSETFGNVSTMSDIWSFACCIVEMVSGHRPWSGAQMSAICFKVTAARDTPEIPSDLPETVQNLLKACFAYDSSARPTFQEIFKIFARPWNRDSPAATRRLGGETAIEDAELLRLRHEEARWETQRKELIFKVRRDACRISELQKNVVEHQEVSEKLQEQLVLLVNSLKKQQTLPANAGMLASDPQSYAAQLELQLAGCQDALKQCMRQKDVAKEMLRQESARTRQLTEEAALQRQMQDRVRDMALRLAVQFKIAEAEVAKVIEEEGIAACTRQSESAERTTRAASSRKPLGHAPLRAMANVRGLYASDTTESESVRETRDSCSSSESSELLKRPTRELTRELNLSTASPTAASASSPILSQASTPMVSAQNSWEIAQIVAQHSHSWEASQERKFGCA